MSRGDSGTTTRPPPTTTAAGSSMLPVPRTMLPRMLNIQTAIAPAKIAVEYDTAAASAPSRPPMNAKERRTAKQHATREERGHARSDDQGVHGEGVGSLSAVGAEGPGDGRGHAAAHAARGHRLHQHDQGEDDRHASQRVGAQPAHEVGLEDVDGRLHGQDHDIGRGQAQQGGRNRAREQAAG